MKAGKTFLINSDFPQFAAKLCEFGKVASVKSNPYLPLPVAAHADMNYCDIGNTLFIAGGAEIPEFVQNERKFVRFIDKPGDSYPDDVICNCKLIGERLFCNVRTISPEIIEFAECNGYQIIDVRQGYTGCGICKVTDNAIITSDKGIAEAARRNGIDVLVINNSEIILPGYDVGFIGGCCGSCESNLFFTGSLSKCSFGDEMRKFCEAHGVAIIELSDERPVDVGGIMII